MRYRWRRCRGPSVNLARSKKRPKPFITCAAGRLETLLDAYTQDEGQFWALWPSSRHLSPKVRVFVDFIEQRLFKAAVRANPTPAAT